MRFRAIQKPRSTNRPKTPTRERRCCSLCLDVPHVKGERCDGEHRNEEPGTVGRRVGLNTCGEVGGAGCAAFLVAWDPSATCDGTFPTSGGMLAAGNLH